MPSLDFEDLDTNDHLILIHLLLIIKMYIYNARATGWLIEYKPSAGIYKGIKDTKKNYVRMMQEGEKKKWKNILIN